MAQPPYHLNHIPNPRDFGPRGNLLSILESCANLEVIALLDTIPNESSSHLSQAPTCLADWLVYANFAFTASRNSYPIFPSQGW
jgi:hypothetical protein